MESQYRIVMNNNAKLEEVLMHACNAHTLIERQIQQAKMQVSEDPLSQVYVSLERPWLNEVRYI